MMYEWALTQLPHQEFGEHVCTLWLLGEAFAFGLKASAGNLNRAAAVFCSIVTALVWATSLALLSCP